VFARIHSLKEAATSDLCAGHDHWPLGLFVHVRCRRPRGGCDGDMFQQERERASATRRSPRHRDRPDLHILAGPCLPGTFCRVLAEKNGAGRRGFLSHPVSADKAL